MAPLLRILFLEDLPAEHELAQRELRAAGLQFTAVCVDAREPFLQALQEFQPDLIISDYSMPDFTGMQALILAQNYDSELPFIILTGAMNEETAVNCMKAGATNYVLKDRLQRLPLAVQDALKQQQVRKEKTQAEAQLRESEAKFKDVFETANVGKSLTSFSGEINVNQAFCDLLGYTRDELRHKNWQELTPPQDIEIVNKEIALLMSGAKKSTRFTKRCLHKNGAMIWVDVSVALRYDAQGNPLHFITTIVDITDRIAAEAALLSQSELLQRSNNELARLYRISAALISPKPFDLLRLAQTIVDTVVREFDIPTCCLYLRKKITNELVRLAYTGEISEKYLADKLSIDGAGIIALAIRTRQVQNVADVSAHPDYVVGWEAARSELVIPLFLNESAIGALNLESDKLSNFTSGDEKLLQIFANQAAIVLENANLIAETSVQVQRLKSLRKIDEAINSSLDLGITAGILLEQITYQLRVDAADILLFNPFTRSLNFINGRGFNTAALQHTDLLLGQGLAGRAANERQMVHVSNLSACDEFFKRSLFLQEERFFEYYGIPLVSKGTVKGVLEVFHRSPLKTDDSWVEFLETLAGQTAIAIDNIQMFENLQRSNDELAMAYDATIEGWSSALDLRDRETEGHARRVTEITVRLAKAIGVQGEELLHIRRGALLHDIGKLGIFDRILLKPGSLTAEEWMIMRKHPDYAYQLLSPIAFLKQALDIPYCHHEKWDGSGYPRGLKGEQIPLSARLFAVADVWDALISDRPYRAAWPQSQAVEYIREQAGKHFDPQVVEAFINSYLSEESSQLKPTILIVDDEESVTRSLARSLKDHFTVLTANSGADALKIVERSDPAVVLTDQRMLGMSGVELLERIRAIKPKSVGILISGYSDAVALTAALNLSTVRGFIPKPWDLDVLRTKLEEAVAQYREISRGFKNQP